MRSVPRLILMVIVVAALFAGLGSCTYLAPRRLSAGPALHDGKVLFRFFAPNARRVQLAGDWPGNNWGRGDGSVGEANVGLMDDADGDGVWEILVELGPGRYRYLFWVDEVAYHTDPGNPEDAAGGPHGVCSLIVVFEADGRVELR